MKSLIFALLVASFAIHAADLTTKSGKTYKNYNVDRPTPYGLSIFHDNGTTIIPYPELPAEIRVKYQKKRSSICSRYSRNQKEPRAESQGKLVESASCHKRHETSGT